MSTTIWKFPLTVTDRPTIKVPQGAIPLTVQTQGDAPHLWALVDPAAPREWVSLRIYGTGHPVEANPGRYLGTFQLSGGLLIFHAFYPEP